MVLGVGVGVGVLLFALFFWDYLVWRYVDEAVIDWGSVF